MTRSIAALLVALSWPAVGLAQERIESETVVHPDTSVRWGRASTVVDASVDEVLDLITNYAQYRTFMPHVTTSRVLQARGGPNAILYLQATAAGGGLTLWAQLHCFARENRGDTRIIEARMLRGNMDRFVAVWEVTPVDNGRAQLVLQLLAEPDLPLPAFVLSEHNEDAARWTLQSVRRRLRHDRTGDGNGGGSRGAQAPGQAPCQHPSDAFCADPRPRADVPRRRGARAA